MRKFEDFDFIQPTEFFYDINNVTLDATVWQSVWYTFRFFKWIDTCYAQKKARIYKRVW